MIATALSWIAGKWFLAKALPGSVATTVSEKRGLFLYYAMIAAILILMVLSTSMWGKAKLTEVRLAKTETTLAQAETDKQKLSGRLTTVENVNQLQDAHIKELEKQQGLDQKALQKNSADIETNKRKVKSYETRLKDLETTSPEYKALSDTVLPDKYRSMLNSTKPTARNRNKTTTP